MNHPVTSMIRCPPLCEYTLSPSFETGTMLDAARVWPDRSVLSSDASGNGEPAGWAVKNPGALGAVVVALIATATASAGTPGGRFTTIDSPATSGRPKLGERLSNTRRASIGTYLPAVATSAGRNHPVTSTMMCVGTEALTSIAPSAPSLTIAPLARSSKRP